MGPTSGAVQGPCLAGHLCLANSDTPSPSGTTGDARLCDAGHFGLQGGHRIERRVPVFFRCGLKGRRGLRGLCRVPILLKLIFWFGHGRIRGRLRFGHAEPLPRH